MERQRREPVDVLAFRPQRLPAGRQNVRPGFVPLKIPSAKVAAASITCSQLSSTMRTLFSLRNAIRPGSGFSEWTPTPSRAASVLGTS